MAAISDSGSSGMCSYVFIRGQTSSNNVAHPPPPSPSLHLLLDCSWRWKSLVQRARWAAVACVAQRSALRELRVLSLCRCCGTLTAMKMHDYIVYMIMAYIVSVFGSSATEHPYNYFITVTCKLPLLSSPGKLNNRQTWATNVNINIRTQII